MERQSSIYSTGSLSAARELAMVFALLCFLSVSLILVQIWMMAETFGMNSTMENLAFAARNVKEHFPFLVNATPTCK